MDCFPLDRRALLAGVVALPLAACAPRVATSALRRLRLVTFNIWHDAGDWPVRRALLVAALRDADADVIALQEVLEDATKGLANQAETLAAALGGYAVHFTSADPAGAPRRYGNAILTRLPVMETASRKLEPLNDYRTALRVRVAIAGHPVDIVATHLAHQPDAGPMRTRQVADLLGWLPRDGAPLVVLGDFNAPLADMSIAPLRARGLDNALLPAAVTTTLNPAKGHAPRVIDHIFADARAFALSDARVFGDQPSNGEYPSDHFGVAASLTLL